MVRNRDPVMPLSDEQKAALQTLAAADPKEVADGLKEHAPNAYQTAFRVGYGTAKGEFEPKLTAEREAKEAAEAAAAEAKQQAESLAGKDTDFAAEKARLEKAAQDAKAEAKQAKTDAEASVKGFYRTAQEKALLAKLSPVVDPLYAENAVVPAARDRIRIDGIGEDGTPTVSYLDADGVPLSGGLDALAQQLAAGVDARFKTSKVDAGGGATNGSGGATGGAEGLVAAMKARYANDPNKAGASAAPRANRYAPHSG